MEKQAKVQLLDSQLIGKSLNLTTTRYLKKIKPFLMGVRNGQNALDRTAACM
jgi:hypothetical protein